MREFALGPRYPIGPRACCFDQMRMETCRESCEIDQQEHRLESVVYRLLRFYFFFSFLPFSFGRKSDSETVLRTSRKFFVLETL
jgi:hypothetical protein